MLARMAEIVWWEIETPAPEVFQRFHGAMWGWGFEPAFADSELDADYWIIKVGDKSIGGLQRAAGNAHPHAGTRLYVEVADLEEVLREIEARGGQVERSRTALGGDDRWFATAFDPTGVSFGLWTSHPPTESLASDGR
jgi:predicted enzyme related to lactoylglutathione lyase